MMNIFALPGHKVKFAHPTNGYRWDQEKAAKYLTVGEIYTVERTYVDSSSTEVYLLEFPDVYFNSVLFDDVEEQPSENDRRHQDWDKYNED